jgi:hypothetical protein
MRTMRQTNVVLLGVALMAGVPLAAQQAAEPADASLKAQITAFEGILKSAVERGGQQLAQWAGEMVPTVELVLAEPPKARGVPLPDSSLFFDVQIPGILNTSLRLWEIYVQQRPSPAAVAQGDRVAATGVVPDDPMVAGTSTEANQQYSDYVREALIQAMLTSSGVLPLDEGQWLTVAARDAVDDWVQNPLYQSQSRKLILSIRGEDLRALRDGDITIEEARSRIVERRF